MPGYHLAYRPEIDGLRAVAVLSVVIFHLNRRWLPGGFVGVDIFFVISGYLITAILFNDCKTGQFNLARFYQRRIARIFPAFFVVGLATVAATKVAYSAQDFASAGANLVAASLSIANFKYMLQGSYFQISPDAQPFLHYWSLSVEEQFYAVFPLLLFFLVRHARQYLLSTLALLGIASFAACVLLTQAEPGFAFYLLPTRAWELGAGGVLAIARAANDEPTVCMPRWLSEVGVLLIGCSFVFIHEGPTFPGWHAIVPVVGTVAIILHRADRRNWVEKALSSQGMVAVGRMSYSLYLWHWPVFSLIDYRFYLMPIEMRLLLKISVSLLLSIIAFRAIEVPARNFLNHNQHRGIAFVTMSALVALCVPLGITIRHNNYINAEPSDVAKGGLVFPGRPGASSVVLMGDSNGSMYGKVMKEICEELGANLTVISVAAGDVLPSPTLGPSKLWTDSLRVVRDVRPDYLVIANEWVGKLNDEPNRLVLALEALEPYVGQVILLNQPPILPRSANRSDIRDGARPPFRELPETRAKRHKVNELLLSVQSANVSVVDVSQLFETESGDVIFADAENHEYYHDATHLSGYGTERVRDDLTHAVSAR